MRIHVRMHQDGMKRTYQIVVLSILLLAQCTALLFTPNTRAEPTTLYVGQGELYTTIQAALDNASDGYRIFVYNGTYHEHLTITKRIDLFGEDNTITIINGSHTGTLITITSPSVNISHFTLTTAGTNTTDSLIDIQAAHCIITDNILTTANTGIHLNHTGGHLIYDNTITDLTGDGLLLNASNTNTNISYNTITDCRNAILATNSDHNPYYHNTLTHNTHNGIFLNHSLTSNTIHQNNLSDNNHNGIYLNDYTNYTTITDNTITHNHDTGIALENCSQTTITDNTITTNTNYGLKIIGAHTTITTNTITDNQKDGIYLSADNNNTINQNTITGNHNAGLRLYNSTADWITTNTIHHNQYGIYLDFFTTHNLIYNNDLHQNTINAQDKSLQQNHWNTTPLTGTNIIGGPTLSGNYYDTYANTSQGATDANHDGLADTPYTIYADNKDDGPLLDTIPPTLTTPHITPTTQTLGGTTTITVTTTDNTKITSVTLTIKTPTNTHLTIPITQNKTGTTYTCTRRYLTVGNYTANITATDPRNTQTSTTATFAIAPGTPPTIKDTSPKNTTPHTLYHFTVNVTSPNAGPANLTVYANWTHHTKHANTTLARTSGNTFTANILLDKSTRNLTYRLYARDTWGNANLSKTATVRVIDTQKPHILVTSYGPSFAILPGSFTFRALITDDSTITNATIEYWTTDQPHRTVAMDHPTTTTYEKIIIPEITPNRVYCIINATDEAGNYNTTKNPTAKPDGPYRALVNQPVLFNGSQSYDLDGNITTYNWSFGDGTTANGSTLNHTYYANGTYTLTLTVTDNDGRNGTNTTKVEIGTFSVHFIPLRILTTLNSRYSLSLTSPFYCYDANEDGRVDSFYDPNNRLYAVHNTSVNLSGTEHFTISLEEDDIPEFLWNTKDDTIEPITHTQGTVADSAVNEDLQQAVLTIHAEKASWIYVDVADPYPTASLSITTGTRTIPSTLIWREDNHIHLLDDPETSYIFTFNDIYPPLEATFSPPEGGIIGEYSTTISVSFNAPVIILMATFGDADIKNSLVSSDGIHFGYTPPSYLANGTYSLLIDVQALHGTHFLSAESAYIFFTYGTVPKKSLLEQIWPILVLGLIVGGIGSSLLVLRVKRVTLDGSVYIRSKRLLPFFKTVVVGPVSVHIDDARLQKAEFYVDGALKQTATTFPYTWQWKEKALFKHTLETRVYNGEGNSVSTGPVDVFLFNPYRARGKE